MRILVGDTGFVGSNLKLTMHFDRTFNSKNIYEAYNLCPDILIYAGVRGTKILANKYPLDDEDNIGAAIENIKSINPKKLILISTVDVYDNLDNKDEDYISNEENLHVYGRNRLQLEKWVVTNMDDYHIMRLPAVYGENLHKNFVYDLISPIPAFVTKVDFELIKKEFSKISLYYTKRKDCYFLNKKDNILLRYFENSKYNSLRFTDCRSIYQYFDLRQLYKIIELVVENKIKCINCVTEPLESNLVYKELTGKVFNNYINNDPIKYRLTTKYAHIVKQNNYLQKKQEELEELMRFIKDEKEKI